MTTLDPLYDQGARLLQRARRVLVLTGAGISAESGLPTYRGVGGIYQNGPTAEGYAIEEILSGGMFQQRPELTWTYLAALEQHCRGAQPNRAHRILAEWEQRFALWVVTQNVDSLHRLAGSRNLIEVHGNLHRLRCTVCGYAEDVASYDGLALPPRCPDCGAVVRPDIVLFNEMLPEAAVLTYERELSRGFDLMVVIGTSAQFPYIAGPVFDAAARGVTTMEINPVRSDLSAVVDLRIPATACQALTALASRLTATTVD